MVGVVAGSFHATARSVGEHPEARLCATGAQPGTYERLLSGNLLQPWRALYGHDQGLVRLLLLQQHVSAVDFRSPFITIRQRLTPTELYLHRFPTAFFFGFAILIVQYCADKFCLMRIWGWSPELGAELARFSRRYFFSGAVVAYFLVSAYAWAQFPYDNVCDPVNATYSAPATYVNVLAPADEPALKYITVTQDTEVVYCPQSWRLYNGFPFPPTSRLQPDGLQWMHGTQETLVNLYGWTACVVAALFIVSFFGTAIVNFLLSWFRGIYVAANQNQHIDYSSNDDIHLYIPQIRRGGMQFPLLACDVDHIDHSLIGWTDPVRSYDYWNMIYDIPWDGMPRQKVEEHGGGANSPSAAATRPATPEKPLSEFSVPTKPIFSIVKYYPPPWKAKLRGHTF
jgi:hypothetical protein